MTSLSRNRSPASVALILLPLAIWGFRCPGQEPSVAAPNNSGTGGTSGSGLGGSGGSGSSETGRWTVEDACGQVCVDLTGCDGSDEEACNLDCPAATNACTPTELGTFVECIKGFADSCLESELDSCFATQPCIGLPSTHSSLCDEICSSLALCQAGSDFDECAS